MANSSPAKKVLLILMPLLLLAVPVLTAPNTVNIQGKLTNPSGSLLTGTFNFTFRIYDSYTSGSKLYETNVTLSTDARGVYDIILKDVNITFADQLYLGVKVNNDAEMEPRVNLTSNPSAFRANISDDLNKNNAYTISGVNVTGNLSLGQRLVFNLGQFIDNLADGWVKLTGALNVTSGASIGGGLNISEDLRVNNQLNITSAGNLVTAGSITSAGTIQGATLTDGNATITGGVVSANEVKVGGGFNAGGMTLLGADIITQGDILFSGNISVLNVTHLSVNGSILPALDSIFDIGNSSFRWRNANFTGRIESGALSVNGSTLYVDNANGRVGIGTTAPAVMLHMPSGRALLGGTTAVGDGSLELQINSTGQPTVLDLVNRQPATTDLGMQVIFRGHDTSTENMGRLQFAWAGSTTNAGTYFRINTRTSDAAGDTEKLRITPSGNVGIGTTSPNDILEVIGNVRVSGSLNATSINATNMYAVSFPLGWTNLTDYPSACAPGQFMTAIGDTIGCASPAETSSAAGGWANTSTVTATALSVVVDSGTFYVNATTNNVGIGTTSPSAPLHVLRASAGQVANFSDGTISVVVNTAGSPNRGIIGTESNHDLRLMTNSGAKVTISTDGNVGIGTTSPVNALTIIGSVSAFGSLNATYINATEIRVGSNIVQVEKDSFKQGNFTSAYDARTDRYGKSNYSDEYASTGFDNENFTTRYDARSDRFGLANYSSEYSSTGYKLSNFTSNYDARSDRYSITNYSAEYASTGYKLANFTSNLNSVNASISLWNGTTNIYPREITGNVGIGTTSPGKKLEVAGTINATQLNITGRNINSSFEGDLQIKGTLYGGSPLKISGGLNITSGNLTTLPGARITGNGSVPTGMIAFFASTSCPAGWDEYTAARGRAIVGLVASGTAAGTVGTALTNQEDRTHPHTGPSHSHTYSTAIAHTHTVAGITVAGEASHTHGVGTYDAAAEAAHTHGVGTYDAAAEAAHTHGAGTFAGDSNGAHTHTVTNGIVEGDSQLTGTESSNDIGVVTTSSNGAHTHTISGTSAAGSSHDHALSGSSAAGSSHDHALSGSSAAGSSHDHALSGDSAAGTSHDHALSGSSAAGSSHTHSLSGSTDSTGSASGTTTSDGTGATGTAATSSIMPYIQLIACQAS